MKKLITLLAIVLTVQCFGQVAQFDGLTDKILRVDATETNIGGCDTCGTISKTPITIEDIERFVNWCNDSIHYSHYYEILDSVFENGYTFHIDTIYTATHPTFEGFYKWLKDN